MTTDKLPNTLQELNCGHNEITKIENLPNNLQYLDCSYNRIIN